MGKLDKAQSERANASPARNHDGHMHRLLCTLTPHARLLCTLGLWVKAARRAPRGTGMGKSGRAGVRAFAGVAGVEIWTTDSNPLLT